MALLGQAQPNLPILDPGPCRPEELEAIHTPAYIEAVRRLSDGESIPRPEMLALGFGTRDVPVFQGMFEASLEYCGGTIRAAEAVVDGAPLAFGIAGGLHHARPAQASGFCIFNDAALACGILRRRCDRVAYVDIDLHHGDGVELIWRDDPSILTYSIHQNGRTLYPGTGFLDDGGPTGTAINVPLPPRTGGDAWLHAFRRTALPILDRFRPGAIVLQMGTDAHRLDPLGHLEARAQDWLAAVAAVRDLGVPIVAIGGGGYDLTTVPRMWVGAILTLQNLTLDDSAFAGLPADWEMQGYLDPEAASERGMEAAEEAIRHWDSMRDLIPTGA